MKTTILGSIRTMLWKLGSSKIVVASGLVGVLLFLQVTPCYANPILLEPVQYVFEGLFFLVLLTCVAIVEFVIIAFFLRKKIRKGKGWVKLFTSVFLINAITLPVTLFLAFQLEETVNFNHLQLIFGVELFPLVAECLLYRWRFAKLYRQGFIMDQISGKMIVAATVAANLVTFLPGLLLLT